MKLFRLLRADEIEARIQSVQKNGCIVLLYKDARCDMNILDETFGASNWQRNHEIIDGNLYCNVGINFKGEDGFNNWVWKQDVGTESNTEKEKGQASDSFKRACFNWGIGRELYTSPFIYIPLSEEEIVKDKNGNGKCYTKFFVKEIEYNDKEEISRVVIVDDKGNQRFPKEEIKRITRKLTPSKEEDGTDYKKLVQQYIEQNGFDKVEFCKTHKLNGKSSQAQFKEVWEMVNNGTRR